jgi:cytochrome c oxidase accessory protein FixG
MCPWPRIQGAMTDRHTMLVSYRTERGEPRGPLRKGPDGAVDWTKRGDCIDCKACVVVCPAGIDIRDGSQLECIQCALCIDACNDIMDRIARPRGLIAYDTTAKREASAKGGAHEAMQIVRPRTLLYAGLFALVGAIMLGAWFNRTILEVNVLADRVPPYVQLADGSIRNGYTVKVLNKLHERRRISLSVADLPGATLTIIGSAGNEVDVATDDLAELRVSVTVPADAARRLGTSSPLSIVVTDVGSRLEARRRSLFHAPGSTGGQP